MIVLDFWCSAAFLLSERVVEHVTAFFADRKGVGDGNYCQLYIQDV